MMTKLVHPNAMVAHLWANQSQESARSNNGQVFFNGRKLYSYGSHFLTGIVAGDGKQIVTTRTYSPTTGGHVSDAWSATRGDAIRLPALDGIEQAILRLTCQDLSAPYYTKDSARRDIMTYLATHAADLSDDAGAYMYGLASKSGQWQAMKARALSAQAKAKAKTKAAELKRIRETAAHYAKQSLPAFRARLSQIAGVDSEYQREREFRSLELELYHAHRNAGGKRIKAAVWAKLKLTRAFIFADEKRGPARRRVRGAIADIKRIWLGHYHGPLSPERLGRSEIWEHLQLRLNTIASEAPAVRAGLKDRLAAMLSETDSIRREILERERLAEKERRRVADAERFAKEAEQRAAWLDGTGRLYGRLSDESGGALIRAVGAEIVACEAVAGTLETSHGANVPLGHAVRAFRFVKAVRASGEPWQAKGRAIRVGSFTLDSIAANGDFIAGCHRIHWPEIERLATSLGVFDCAPISEGVATNGDI